MQNLRRLFVFSCVVMLLQVSEPAAATQNSWDQIFLNGPIETTLPDGSTRTLMPSCSGGPQPTAAGPVPADTQYYFFVQEGNPNKILIGLDGGGACWDALTCVGSPLGGQSTYTVALDETPARLANAEGFFDSNNPKNPFHNYTKVFIPYCSGDVHWGSRDTVYVFDTPFGPLPWIIHHRGLDNFLGVLDWLQKNGRKQYRVDFGRARDVTVAGASAGGYGANVAFAYVAELTPRARHSLVSDAAIGVLTSSFYQTAIFDPAGSANWGVEGSLPSWVPGFTGILAQGAAAPNSFLPMVFMALADYKPNARMASLTTNLDLVQVGFYSLMRNEPPQAVALDWYFGMRAITAAAAALPNYRFFIEDGTFHTFIGSDDATYGVGANGISVAEWVRAMIKPGNRTWDNLDAGPPSLP